jgi:hypothetical protein
MVAGAARGRLAKMHLDQKTAEKEVQEREKGKKIRNCALSCMEFWSSRSFHAAVTIETPHDQLPQHEKDGKAAELRVARSYDKFGNHQK